MEKANAVLGILGSIALIAGVVFYIGTHVDCAKIPLIGSVCVATK
jgi:hypothetical protein